MFLSDFKASMITPTVYGSIRAPSFISRATSQIWICQVRTWRQN